jgi:predicted CXXCH cytochrome family protein
MKSKLVALTLRFCTAVLATLVFASVAHAQIATSDHDLSSGLVTNADKNEICVYCHTPHASNNLVEAPLWNKPAVAAAYQTYDSSISSTLDGTVLALGSVSIACLSCHDGTQAMDTVINAPGSGGYNAAGTSMGTSGVMPTTTIANLISGLGGGGDLANDHPIGILYGGFDTGGGVKVDDDFNSPATAVINATDQWWVDTTGGTASREKTDMILYARDDGGTQKPFVECASCHDPHEPSNGTFLRVSNDSSAVCLACHVK